MDWNKFHPLFGPDLKVGFETTFPKTADLSNLNPLYSKSGLVYEKPNESVIRIYEPATEIQGSCLDGEAAQVFFEPVPSNDSFFRRLVFARRVRHRYRARKWQPLWMVAARHDEPIPFGFDALYSVNGRYLSLAYPGLEEQFVPVYLKIQDRKGEFVYLEVWAWDERDNKVVVQGRRLTESLVPDILILAEPNGMSF